jgi:hypothetical protein
MSDTPPPQISLGDTAARQLANATKSVQTMSIIAPRWLPRCLQWLPVEAGVFRARLPSKVIKISVLSLVDGPVELCVTRLRYPQNHGLLCGQMSTAKRQPPTSLLIADRQPGYHDRARRPDISRVALQFAAMPKPANPQSDAEQRSDEAAIHAAAGILTSINKANAECDAQATSALYAEDATVSCPTGCFPGGQPSRKPTHSSTSGPVRTLPSSNMSW